MSGLPEVDMDDWEKNTTYANGYDPEYPVIMVKNSLDSRYQCHKLTLRRFSKKNLLTLNQDFSRFLHRFYQIIHAKSLSDLVLAVHQRLPIQKLTIKRQQSSLL